MRLSLRVNTSGYSMGLILGARVLHTNKHFTLWIACADEVLCPPTSCGSCRHLGAHLLDWGLLISSHDEQFIESSTEWRKLHCDD